MWRHRGLRKATTTLVASFHTMVRERIGLCLFIGPCFIIQATFGHWKNCCALLLWHLFGVGLMQYGHLIGFLAIDDLWQGITPWAASSTNTWVNQPLLPCQRLGCVQGSSVLQWAITGTFNWRNIPTSLWRGTERSGGLVVLKRRFTVSLRLLDVFSGFCLGAFVWFVCFCFWTSSLLHIHLLSNRLRSVDRPCY